MAEGIEVFERTFRNQIQADGEIKDLDFAFKRKFGGGEDEWPIERGRYRLIWMPACPHAHKVVITRNLLGLDKVISLGTTGIYRTTDGWAFTDDPEEKDPVLGVHLLKDIYDRDYGEAGFPDRPTVPVIVDTKTGHAANNDHFWHPIYLNMAWKPYHKKNAPDLYPEELRTEIDQLNQYIFKRVNEGVYNVGFARSQAAYEKAYHLLFEALDILDKRLEDRRFLLGDYITDADIRLYPTLARFDVAYFQVFRANRNRLIDFKNLCPYARDIYQIPEIKEVTSFETYKKHYQLSPHLKPLWGNIYSLVAKGPDTSVWKQPAGREKLSRHPDEKFKLED